jgi:hypothetical protein
MAILTVKNRYAAEPFVGMFDGQTYVVKDTLAVPDYVAFHLKKQSVVKDNPATGNNEYRLAILERGDDDSPLAELPIEAMDRTDMNEFQKVKYVGTGIKSTRPEQRARFGSIEIAAKDR